MRQKGFSAVLLILFVAAVFAGLFFSFKFFRAKTPFIQKSNGNFESRSESTNVSSNLHLPFDIGDIDENDGVVNPVGVVRFSKDLQNVGHSGIDVPLFKGAPIYAVGDGEIVLIESSQDDWGGMDVFELLERTGEGEGWGFLYEHIKPADGIEVGSKVKTGDMIGTKSSPNDFTAHFQLSRLFHNFEYTDNVKCWVDFLDEGSKKSLLTWWESYRQSAHFKDSWNTIVQEGKHPFRKLLNSEKYSRGPQLCYELGTDVREEN